MKNLKKNILLSFVLLIVCSVSATNMYWVGGTGSWNEVKHWSLTTGGPSGTTIPTVNDDVYFDENSFSADKQTVKVTTSAVCRNIDWSAIDNRAILSSGPSKTLIVYGSYKLSPLLYNGFLGKTIFAASILNNSISTAGKMIIGNWEFNGSGSWILTDDVTTEKPVSITLTKGSLNTNGKTVYCGSFIGNSAQQRALDLSSSEIFIKDKWDFSAPTQLTFETGTSRLIFEDSLNDNKFRSGGLIYNSVSAMAAACTPSGTPCATFTISLTSQNVTCNGLCNGTASATVVPAAGPYSYDWSPGAPLGDGTANITALCTGTYTVRVTNTTTGAFCFCSIAITEPGVLFDFELVTVPPTCNGLCNGTSTVAASGGTGLYTYAWTIGGLPPGFPFTGNGNDTVAGVCAGSYDVTVSDQNGCTGSTTIVVTQPAVLVAPGSSTNVTCFGFCNGTASVVASGGSPPYTYDWTPGTPTGDGTANVTNLCPGSYTCTVTDTNACTTTFVAVITQPPILTLTMSQTNASCGGICDGTATATITGGTSPYTYVWSNGSTTTTASLSNTISGLCDGLVSVTVTDANGCNLTNSVTITEPPILVATATGTNVTCFGLCNGTATVVVVGGSGGNTFDWTPGAPIGDGTATITGLCPGSYTVTVVDINGCTDTGVVVIAEPTLLVANFTSTNLLCFVPCDGTATALPTGGTPGYTYNWLPGTPTGDGTTMITNLCAGTYSVIVTDLNGCIDTSAAIVISQPPVLNDGATSTNVTCNGACNGTATSTPTGGTPGYTFLWMPGGFVTPTISGLCPGSYTVTVTDANGCTNSGTVVITQPNVLNVSIATTALACNGDCNAIATATITGGTALFTIDWTPGAPIGDGTTTISSLCAGPYTINVTDANGCPATASATIFQPTALVLATSTTDISCFGACNGTASAIAGGGTPGYSFSWLPGAFTTSSISGLCPGSYTVTVTDLNGCTISDTVTITQPTQVFANPSVVSNISCAGVIPCDGSATATPSGGVGPYSVFDWSPGVIAGDGTPTVTGLCAGNYNVTILDANGCPSTMPVTITQPLVLSAPITSSTSSCNICNGTATVTPAGGTPGYTFLWMPTGQVTQTAVGLCPNITYTVTVTDANGCIASSTVLIMQTIIISITTSPTTLSCFGACDGIVTANAAGGTLPYSFVWTGPTPSGTTVSLTQTATGLCAGTYVVNVSDAAGCFNSDSITFTNPPILTISAVSTNETCSGSCNGTGTAAGFGGTGALNYSWNTVPVQNTATATGLCSGTYTVTVTDGSGCTATTSITITGPPAVVDNVTITPANCLFADGQITVAPTGGAGAGTYTFNWGPGAPAGDGTPTITGLLPGIYTVAITTGGCTYNFSYILNNIAGPTTTMLHTNVSCFGACDGTASVVAAGGAGGYVFDWTPGAPTGDGTAAITGLCGTITYTVQVTDAAGCITFDLDTVNNPALISPNQVVVNESCGGTCDGTITLTPSGGTGTYTYVWSGGLPPTAGQTGLCASGSPYTVTITDANGCDTTLTISIVSPPMLIVTLSSTNVLCAGACNGTASATVVGGTGAGTYTYAWSPNPPLGPLFPLPNVVGLCPGTYDVTVTDGNGCTASDTVTITEPVALTTITSQTNASCFGVCDGQAIVTPSGGTPPYTFVWNPGAIANDTASGLCAGNYIATVTDFNGCVSSPPAVIITEPAPILPNATFVNPTCSGTCNGIATATPTGGTGVYTYSWDDGLSQTTQTAVGLCAGVYIVTVDDGNCSNIQSVTLTDPPALVANASATSPTCVDDCDGSVTSNPIGGTGTYTYLWNPGSVVTQTVINLCPNNYTVIVNDGNGCADTQVVVLANPLGIDVVIGSTPANCGACDGTISLVPTTGTGPYTFVWTIGGLPPPLPFVGNGTPNVTNVCAGLYDVLVTDADGCDSLFTIPMNNSSGPTGETVITTSASCNGVCDGTGSVTPIGGIAPYTFLWNDGPPATALDTAFGLCAGNYFVQVTDASGCIHFSPVTIIEPTPIVPNEVITMALCSNICTGAIVVTPSGGTAGYTYFWAPGVITGQGTNSVSGLCAGTYTLTITDANSCVQVDSFVVGQSTPLLATINSTNISCSSACSGIAYVNISSGTGPYTIQWNDSFGQTNDTASALCAGNYSVDITDALGCTITLNITITSTPPVLANAVITASTCGLCDGTAGLTPIGGTAGYTYLWSNGQITSSASALCSGLYTVDITDANGCVTSVAIPVNNIGGPTSATIVSTNITCNGLCNGVVTSVTPVGGTAPYTFLWIGSGATTSSVGSLCAGTYFVQITDANGCSLIDSVIITEPAAISANQVILAATCGLCDGSVVLAPTGGAGGYAYLWNTGATTSSLASLCAGVYSVDITDAAGCIINVVITINSQSGPTLVASSTSVTCNGSCNATASVVALGSSPFAYLWTPTLQTTPITTAILCAGTYFVQVTDNAGCVTIASTTISEPDSIGFSVANAQDPLCNGNANGSITVIPFGGTLSYAYSWTPTPALGQTTGTAINLDANTYVVTVTDTNGCVATQTITLVNPVSLTISSTFVPSSCNTIPDGSIDVTVGGGTLPYAYQWSGGSTATTEDLVGVLSGTYTITVTDSNSCTIADTIILLPNQTVIAVAGNDTAFCQSSAVTLSAATSVNGTSFQWFDMSGTLLGSSVTLTFNPPAGTNSFYVVVDNGTGCTDSDTVDVTANPLPNANAGTDVTIVIGATTTIGGSPTTTTGGATIAWLPATGLDNATASNPNANPTTTTTYTVTVTSAQGCTAVDSVVVTVRPTIIFPDGISPNADGANDEWIIDGIDLFPDCVVEVYNRWGELLFQSIGYKENWNGTYKGQLLPVGTYYYVIDLKDELFPDAYTGPITILR